MKIRIELIYMLKGREMNLNKFLGRIGKNNCKKLKAIQNENSHAPKTERSFS